MDAQKHTFCLFQFVTITVFFVCWVFFSTDIRKKMFIFQACCVLCVVVYWFWESLVASHRVIPELIWHFDVSHDDKCRLSAIDCKNTCTAWCKPEQLPRNKQFCHDACCAQRQMKMLCQTSRLHLYLRRNNRLTHRLWTAQSEQCFCQSCSIWLLCALQVLQSLCPPPVALHASTLLQSVSSPTPHRSRFAVQMQQSARTLANLWKRHLHLLLTC